MNGHKLYVRSADNQQEEWLTCINEDTFQIDNQISESFQVSFTAWLNPNDHVSYDLIQDGNYIVFDDQRYVIKQCIGKTVDNFLTKDVTAVHEIFGIQNFRQFEVNKGNQPYSIDEMMKFIFDSKYNTNDYKYKIVGTFSSVDITDWGNCSGLDAVQKAVDSYGAKWLPDGKTVLIYDVGSYKHTTNKQLIWSHNTNDIELSIDSTSLQNAGMMYGASKDDDHTETVGSETQVDSAGISMTTTPTGIAKGHITTMDKQGVPVYSSPTRNVKTGQYLQNGTQWLIDKQTSIDGTVWYRVSTNGWVKSNYFTFDKTGDVAPQEHVISQVWGQGTIKVQDDAQDNFSVTSTGPAVGTVSTMETDGAPVYKNPPDDMTVVTHLDLGSAWQIDQQKIGSDVTYYHVGNDEWVSSTYISFDKPGDLKPEVHTVSNVSGRGTIKADDSSSSSSSDDSSDDTSTDDADSSTDDETSTDTSSSTDTDTEAVKTADVYDSPFTPQNKVGVTLASGTQWRIDQEVSDGAQQTSWYRVGTNQWVMQDMFDFSSAYDVEPQEGASSDGAQVYDSPFDPQKEVGQILPEGSQWLINGEVNDGAQGKSWYRVSTNGWVEQDDFDFTGATDVEPDTSNDDDSDSDEDYYFKPFFYYNAESVSEHGMIIGDDITNDQIKDVDSMKKYADSTMQTEPVVELTVNTSYQDDSMKIGDTLYLNAEPLGIKTMITLNGVSGNPLTNDSPMTITLDNSKLSKKNINFEISDKLRLADRNNKLKDKTIKKLASRITKLENDSKKDDTDADNSTDTK